MSLQAAALPLAEGGFVTDWRSAGRRPRLFDQAGPLVDLGALKGTRITVETTLRGAAGRWAFRLGCDGQCRLWVNGREALRKQADTAACIDDQETALDLQGVADVRVELTPGRRARRLVLRVLGATAQEAAPDTPERLLARLPVVLSPANTPAGPVARAVVGPAPAGQAEVTVRLGEQRAVTHGGRVVLEVPLVEGVALELRAGDSTRRLAPRWRPTAQALGVLGDAAGVQGATEAGASVVWWREELLRRVAGGVPRLVDDGATQLGLALADLARPDGFSRRTGVMVRAYPSPLDGAPQPYALWVPPGAGQGLPLVIALHPSAYSVARTLRGALGLGSQKVPGYDRAALQALLPTGVRGPQAVVVAPWGYDGTGSRYMGKLDVLHVQDLVTERYGTDPRRVVLTGGSLGGLGTWQVGLRYPDRFSALLPVAGYGSVRLYGNVRGVKLQPWERFLVDRRDNVTFVDNAHDLPMRCVHGERDDPRRSTVVVDRYAALGYPHTYEELPGVGHAAWDAAWEGGAAVALARRRPELPARTVLVTGSYRHAEAYGVRVDQFEDHAALARVVVERKGCRGACTFGAAAARWEVRTENVRRLTLRGRADALVVNGAALGRLDGEVHLASGQRVADAAPPAGEKRPGVSGPLDDIRYVPHTFVYGTRVAAETDTNRRLAEHLADYHWYDAALGLPVIPDTAVTDAVLRERHLVLIGTRASNAVLDRLADRLPIRVDGEAALLRGVRYEGQGPAGSLGVIFVAPNPEAPHHQLVVRTGSGRRGVWLSAWLPDWLPDYVIFDERMSADRAGYLMGARRPIAAGNFDRTWR